MSTTRLYLLFHLWPSFLLIQQWDGRRLMRNADGVRPNPWTDHSIHSVARRRMRRRRKRAEGGGHIFYRLFHLPWNTPTFCSNRKRSHSTSSQPFHASTLVIISTTELYSLGPVYSIYLQYTLKSSKSFNGEKKKLSSLWFLLTDTSYRFLCSRRRHHKHRHHQEVVSIQK